VWEEPEEPVTPARLPDDGSEDAMVTH